MLIEHFSLQDFGRHKHVDFACPKSVVGILGENASGKSTLIQALRWLITNKTDDNLASYIRNGAKKAHASVTLRHKGVRLTITRTITPTTTSAELLLGEEKISGAKKVNERLQEFFGASLSTAANVTFIPQGMLDRLLGDTTGTRHDVLRTLLDVAFADAAATRVTKLVDTLSKGVVDHRPTIALTEGQLASIDERQKAEEAVLATLPDHSGRLRELQTLSTLETRQSALQQALAKAEQEASSIESEMAAFKVDNPNVEQLPAKKLELQGRLTVLSQAEAQHGLLTTLQTRLSQAETELATLEQEAAKTVVPDIESIELQLQAAREQEKLVLAKVAARQTLQAAEADRQARTNELAAVGLRLASAAEPSADGQTIAEQELAEARSMLGLLQAFDPGSCAEGCPLCESKIKPDAALLTQKKFKYTMAKAKAEAVLAELAKAKAQLDALKREHGVAKARLEASETRLSDIARTSVYVQALDGDLDAHAVRLSSELTSLQRQATDARRIQAEAVRRSTSIAHLRETVTNLLQQLSGVKVEGTLADVHNDMAVVRADLGVVESVLVRWDRLRARYDNRSGLVGLRDQWTSAVHERDRLATSLFGPLTPVERLGELIESDVSKLRLEQAAFDVQKGKLAEISKAVSDNQVRLSELRLLQRTSEATLEKTEKLKKLRDALGKDGVTRDYLLHAFVVVLGRAQHHLTRMNTTFTVEPDPDEPFALVFRDLANPTETPLPQDKLSGGQRVRLTLAFLLALHELVVPDIGLLVLDEGSLHLSASSGIPDLRDLIMQVGEEYGRMERQLWVVDHAVELQSAMQCRLQL